MADLNNDILWMVGQYVITIRNNDKIKCLFNIMPSETMIENTVSMLKKMTVPDLKEKFKTTYSYDGRVQNHRTFKFYKEINGVIRRNKHHYILELLNVWIKNSIIIKNRNLKEDSIYSHNNFKRFYEIVDGVIIKYTPEEKDAVFNKKQKKKMKKVLKLIKDLEEQRDDNISMQKYYNGAIKEIKKTMEEQMWRDACLWSSSLKRNKRKDTLHIDIKWDVINDGEMIRHYGGL